MIKTCSVAAVVAPVALCSLLAQGAPAQGLDDLYKIRDGVAGSHVEYHQVTIPKGKDVVLADLAGHLTIPVVLALPERMCDL